MTPDSPLIIPEYEEAMPGCTASCAVPDAPLIIPAYEEAMPGCTASCVVPDAPLIIPAYEEAMPGCTASCAVPDAPLIHLNMRKLCLGAQLPVLCRNWVEVVSSTQNLLYLKFYIILLYVVVLSCTYYNR